MKGCLLAIVQLLTIVNYSNNLIFFENNIVEQFDRDVNNFKISSLLVTKTEKFKMLRTLGSYGLSEEEKEFLNHLESKVNQTANVIKSNQFDSWINDSKYLKFCNLKEVLNDAKTGNYEFISGINIVKNYNMILEGILKVYNFLSHFFSDDNIAHMLLGIYINSPNLIFPKSKWAEDIIALFVSPSIDKQQFSCIFIDVVNYWEQDYNEFYHRGHYAANYNDYGIIVHELGHTLAFLLLMISNPIHATSFNRNLKTVGGCKKINSEITFLDTNFSNYDPKTTYEYIFTEILYRKIVNITSTASSLAISSVKRRLALFTALPSKYGWKYNELLSTSNYFEGEYFAEAFSYWLLTPINQRNYYWELINDSFQEAFQKAKGL